MLLFETHIPTAKSGIEIKKENRGKFTASAKAAGGICTGTCSQDSQRSSRFNITEEAGTICH